MASRRVGEGEPKGIPQCHPSWRRIAKPGATARGQGSRLSWYGLASAAAGLDRRALPYRDQPGAALAPAAEARFTPRGRDPLAQSSASTASPFGSSPVFP
jgi:hypothetical protein